MLPSAAISFKNTLNLKCFCSWDIYSYENSVQVVKILNEVINTPSFRTKRSSSGYKGLKKYSIDNRGIYIVIQLFQLRLSRGKPKRSNMSAKGLLGVTIKTTQTEQNLVSRDTIVAIYTHKKIRSNFKLCGKPMNGNVFGNKTSLSR